VGWFRQTQISLDFWERFGMKYLVLAIHGIASAAAFYSGVWLAGIGFIIGGACMFAHLSQKENE